MDTDHDTWIKIVVALMYSYISIAIVGSRLVSCCQCLDINGFQHGPSFETLQMNFIPRTLSIHCYIIEAISNVPALAKGTLTDNIYRFNHWRKNKLMKKKVGNFPTKI